MDIPGPAETPAEQEDRARTMAAMARLAGGIAHDINNLLTGINGYADLAMGSLADHPAQADLAEIKRSGDRVAALTNRLMAIGRRRAHGGSTIEVDRELTEGIDVLSDLAGSTTKVELRLAGGGVQTPIASTELINLLGRLVENARDAGARNVVVETRLVEAPTGTSVDPIVPPGQWLRIAVADDGAGMDADTRQHAFEPLFTTQPKSAGGGLGKGLGLSIVWGLVAQGGGYVGLGSTPGVGTVVRVYLPDVAPRS